jgi:hypothetical protein
MMYNAAVSFLEKAVKRLMNSGGIISARETAILIMILSKMTSIGLESSPAIYSTLEYNLRLSLVELFDIQELR